MKIKDYWIYGYSYIRTRMNKRVKIKKGLIIYGRNTFLKLDKTAAIELLGNLELNANTMGHNGRSSILRMDEQARLKVSGSFIFYYGADVIIFKEGLLELGNSFINSDCKIRCHSHIVIGDDCKISHDVTIMDSDGHGMGDKQRTKEVFIGNHVWIAAKATILSGVTIGNGAVIGAGAVVVHDIPKNALAAGVPARIIKENISWSD